MAETLHLTLLGKLRINYGDAPVTDFISSKAEALLCYLAVTHRIHYREALVGLLWGDMPETEAKASLRVALSNLRKLVGDHLTITRQTVAFNQDAPYWLDVEEFLVNVEAAEPEPDVERLRTAVELYQSDFLEGFYVRDAPAFEEWTLVQRERLRELDLQALHTLASHYAARREHAMAIDYTTRLLALDPWREEARRQLMLLLARSGQHSAALAQYETCRRLLAEELGMEPMPETTALYNRIHSTSYRQHNLPAQTTPFLGRQKELAEVSKHLASPACRLLTLIGLGGMGKTRLALQAAMEQAQTGFFLDGVYFVPLAALSSASFLVPTIAAALNFAFYGSEDPGLQLLNYLCDKELLLILDNFEHLLDGLDLLVDILKQAAGVKLLVTSQQRLNLQGEWVSEVQGLNFPKVSAPDFPPSGVSSTTDDGGQRGNTFETYSAIQLFVQSAQRVQANFTLSEAEKPCVMRICQLVAGMPLGIELAATWIRVASCQDIVREIERGLDFLSASRRGVPERHQSLRAVFEHSWQLLAEAERRALSKLAIFQGGFRREAAEQVAQARLPLLSALVDKSFLHWNAADQGQAAGRYEMHELLRQYALEKLQADPPAITLVRDQHCHYYATFLRQRQGLLQGRQQKEALAEIGEEIENIRAAWGWAVCHKEMTEIGRFVDSLFLFYEIRSWYQEGEQSFGQAVVALTDAAQEATYLTDTANRDVFKVLGQALARQGAFQRRLGQYRQAEELLQESLELFRRLDDPAEMAFSLNQLGNVAGARGAYQQAKQYYQDSLAIKRESGDQYGIAITLNNLGYIAYLLGEYTEARQLYQESLAICRAIGDDWGLAFALNNLGLVVEAQGEYPEAKQLFQESLAICQGIGDQFVITLSLNNLGLLAQAIGALAEAKQWYQDSLAIGQVTGNRRAIALSLNNLGAAAYDSQDYNVAQQYYRESLAIRREIGDPLGLVYTLKGLASVASALAEFQAARQHFSEALRIATAIHALPATLAVLVELAILLIKENDAAGAAELLTLALHHSAIEKRTKDSAARLLTELAAELPSDVIAAAQAQGQTRQLEAVVAEIIGQKGDSTNWSG